jgi:hypothetical protein
MQNFNRLLQRLADSGVKFVIVGGYAAVTYGSSRSRGIWTPPGTLKTGQVGTLAIIGRRPTDFGPLPGQ